MLKTYEEIDSWLQQNQIKNYIINHDLTVNVFTDVLLLNEIKNIPVQFGVVHGSFICCRIGLTSLKGCPQKVLGTFDCSYNPLKSLKYGPNEVKKSYNCDNCQLTSFTGCPVKIEGDFYCYNNKIKSFKNSPEYIKGSFRVHNNKCNSFKYFPAQVRGFITLNGNYLNKDMLIDFNSVFLDEIITDFSINKEGFILALNEAKANKELECLNKLLPTKNQKLKKRL